MQRDNSAVTDHRGLAGIEWTGSLEAPILADPARLRCFELIPENFFHDRRAAFLDQLRAHEVPVLVHAVELSIGTAEPLKARHFEQVREIMDRVPTVNLSDHLCFTEAGGVEIGQLTPLPLTVEAADVVCRKIEAIQARIQVPFLIENIANRFLMPDPELTEPEFINLILRRTGCGLLLDLHNLHANAENFSFDPFAWLEAIDLPRVDGVHLAGGHYDDEGTLVDSHSSRVPERVWALYRQLCRRVTPRYTIVERTEDQPDYLDLMAEADRAQAILDEEAERRRSDAWSGPAVAGAPRSGDLAAPVTPAAMEVGA